MKNKTTKQGCAGNCAGKSSNNGFKTPKFQRVKDSKGKPIRGVWIRGKQFYARLFIDNGSGQKIDRRVPLEAKTVQDARRELEQLKYLGKTSNLSIRQSQPFNSFRDHYLDSIANMKRKRTYDSENQHLKQWSAFFGNLPVHQISREKIIKYSKVKKSFVRIEFMRRPASNLSNVPRSASKTRIIEQAGQYAKSRSKRSSGVPRQYWREARTQNLSWPIINIA